MLHMESSTCVTNLAQIDFVPASSSDVYMDLSRGSVALHPRHLECHHCLEYNGGRFRRFSTWMQPSAALTSACWGDWRDSKRCIYAAGSSTVVAVAEEPAFNVKLSSRCRTLNVAACSLNGGLEAARRCTAAACNFQLNSSKCENSARNA